MKEFIAAIILSLFSLGGGVDVPPEPDSFGSPIGKATSIYETYAPPHDVFNNNKQIFFLEAERVQTSEFDPEFDMKVWVDHEQSFIYRYGYVYTKNGWSKFSFGEDTFRNTNWIRNYASAELDLNGEDFNEGKSYVVAYSCKRHKEEWKCGHSTLDGRGKKWMLQKFQVESYMLPKEPGSPIDLTTSAVASVWPQNRIYSPGEKIQTQVRLNIHNDAVPVAPEARLIISKPDGTHDEDIMTLSDEEQYCYGTEIDEAEVDSDQEEGFGSSRPRDNCYYFYTLSISYNQPGHYELDVEFDSDNYVVGTQEGSFSIISDEELDDIILNPVDDFELISSHGFYEQIYRNGKKVEALVYSGKYEEEGSGMEAEAYVIFEPRFFEILLEEHDDWEEIVIGEDRVLRHGAVYGWKSGDVVLYLGHHIHPEAEHNSALLEAYLDVYPSDLDQQDGYIHCPINNMPEDGEVVECPENYNPVCGDDGETYSNSCFACYSGQISKFMKGACGGVVPPHKPVEEFNFNSKANSLEITENTYPLNAETISDLVADKNPQIQFIDDLELPHILKGSTVYGKLSDPVYDQRLYFEDPRSGYVQYTEDDQDVTDDFLYFPAGSQIARYELEFRSSFRSNIYENNSGQQGLGMRLLDYEGSIIEMLGKKFTIVKALREDSAFGNGIKLSLIGGPVKDVLVLGQEQKYTIGGKLYHVRVDFVDSNSAKLTVNGETTRDMVEGDTDRLSDGTTIVVSEVLFKGFAGDQSGVQFFLGEELITLYDTNIADSAASHELKVGSETIDGVPVWIEGVIADGQYQLEKISVNMTADDDFYVPSNGKLSENPEMDEPEALFTGNWDLVYSGLSTLDHNPIHVIHAGGTQYKLIFVDGRGNLAGLPIAHAVAPNQLKFGDADDNLIVNEGRWISKDDYFVVTDYHSPNGERNSFALRYRGSDASFDDNPVLKFDDLGSGDRIERPLSIGQSTTINGIPAYAMGTIKLAGSTFSVFTTNHTHRDFDIYVDLNADGQLSGSDEDISINTEYGAEIKLWYSTNNLFLGIETPHPNHYQDLKPSAFNFSITADSNGEVSMEKHPVMVHQFKSPDGEPNMDYAYSSYGAFARMSHPASDPKELFIEYPPTQRFANVKIVGNLGKNTPQPACTDSDGGVNTHIKGTTKGMWNGDQVYDSDFCLQLKDGEYPWKWDSRWNNDNQFPTSNSKLYPGCTDDCGVYEFSCNEGQFWTTAIRCPHGCENGACLEKPKITCTDSDLGDNKWMKGEVMINGDVSYKDYCMDGPFEGYVAESFCDSEIGVSSNLASGKNPRECPNGCFDGACIPDPEDKMYWVHPEHGSKICNYFTEITRYDIVDTRYAQCSGSRCVDPPFYWLPSPDWALPEDRASYLPEDGVVHKVVCTPDGLYPRKPTGVHCPIVDCAKPEDGCWYAPPYQEDRYGCQIGCGQVVCQEDPVQNSGYYSSAYWQCYDGLESESGVTTCKTAETWKKFAEASCAGHCSKESEKCGVNTFKIGANCYPHPYDYDGGDGDGDFGSGSGGFGGDGDGDFGSGGGDGDGDGDFGSGGGDGDGDGDFGSGGGDGDGDGDFEEDLDDGRDDVGGI